MNIWKGKELADQMLESVKQHIDVFLDHYPCLNVIGGDVSNPYYRGILKDAEYCGIVVKNHLGSDLPLIKSGNYISLDPTIRVPDSCNVDGGGTTPCTAEAIVRMLLWKGFEFDGATSVVIGRSERVGRPVATLLTDLSTTVTLAHSRTPEASLGRYIADADLIISCAGNAGFAEKYKDFKKRATLIDVGGDFVGLAENAVENFAPHIGGVGTITRAVLMEHVFYAGKK